MVKRTQAPRTSIAHKKAAIDAALDVVTGRAPEREPQTAEEARNYVSPHDQLAAALKASIASHDRMRGPTDASEHYADIEAACIRYDVSLALEGFDKTRKRQVADVVTAMNIPTVVSVDAFVKWLRRRVR